MTGQFLKGMLGIHQILVGRITGGSGFISGSLDDPTVNGATTHGGPSYRFPFETILEPEVRLPFSGTDDKGKILHLGPQWDQFGWADAPSGSLGTNNGSLAL